MSEAVKKLRWFTQEHAWRVYRYDMDMRADVEEVLAELERLKVVAQEWEEKSNNSVEWAMSAGQKNAKLKAELDRLKNELARSKKEIKRLYTLQVREGGDE